MKKLAIVTMLCVSALALGQSDRGRRALTTLQLMNMRVPEVTFAGVPFEQVMSWLEEYTGVNVNVRWQMLEENGVEKDKPISIKARNLRLSQILYLIMNEAGGTDVKLAYRATGNLILLSTHEDLGKDMITRVYDVSDLLVRIPRFTNAANLNPAQALNQAGQGGAGGGGGGQLFEDNEQSGEGGAGGMGEGGAVGGGTEMQQLVSLITDTVEPESWVANGGLGSITPLRGQIVVRNNILVHQRIGGMLEESTLP